MALAILLPTLGLYLSRAMTAVPVVFLLVPVALLVVGKRQAWRRLVENVITAGLLTSPAVIAIGVLILWGAASMIWAVNPSDSLEATLKAAAFFVLGVIGIATAFGLSAERRHAVGGAAVIGLVVGLCFLGMEWLGDSVISKLLYGHVEIPGAERGFLWLSRGAAVVALLAWPALLWLWTSGRRWRAAGLAILTFLLVKQLQSATVTYGFLASLLFFVVFHLRPKWGAWLLAAGFLVTVVAMPIAANNLDRLIELKVPESRLSSPYENLRTRFKIWDFVGKRIVEKPLAGWGMNASRSIPGGADTLPHPSSRSPRMRISVLPLHPHNVTLQWWLELGLIGAAIAAAAIISLALGMTRWIKDNEALAAGLALLAVVGAISFMSYGAWQSWWMATQAVAATMFAAVLPKDAGGRHDAQKVSLDAG
jgi:O-antigen ligase